MIDYTDAATANQRLSHSERDEAVTALGRYHAEGRLTDAELSQRSETAQTAITRGDLAPLFADLPVATSGGSAGTDSFGTGSAATGSAGTASFNSEARPSNAAGYDNPGQRGHRPWRYAVMSLTPFVALALFFISGNIWGFNYAWLWFLLVPIAGILTYGTGGWADHDRDRYRDR